MTLYHNIIIRLGQSMSPFTFSNESQSSENIFIVTSGLRSCTQCWTSSHQIQLYEPNRHFAFVSIILTGKPLPGGGTWCIQIFMPHQCPIMALWSRWEIVTKWPCVSNPDGLTQILPTGWAFYSGSRCWARCTMHSDLFQVRYKWGSYYYFTLRMSILWHSVHCGYFSSCRG